jgi:hypothetical protein
VLDAGQDNPGQQMTVTAVGPRLADNSAPRRLPWGLAVSVISGMSLGLWVGVWKLIMLVL